MAFSQKRKSKFAVKINPDLAHNIYNYVPVTLILHLVAGLKQHVSLICNRLAPLFLQLFLHYSAKHVLHVKWCGARMLAS